MGEWIKRKYTKKSMLFGQFTKRQKQNGIPTVQETEQTGIVTKIQGINQIIKKTNIPLCGR